MSQERERTPFDEKTHSQIFRLRTQSTVDDGPPSREGANYEQAKGKGKVIGVFTSGGDSQGQLR